MSSPSPLIVILGPTASGKTGLSLDLAKKFQGEVISADSRQMSRDMDVGTAKEKGIWKECGGGKAYIVEGVSHHLMDFLDPDETFTLAQYKKETEKKIGEIEERGHLPFLVGGTGLYISAVVDNLSIPRVQPNAALRASLEEKNEEELFLMLQNLDPESAKKIDAKNKRRIIRAIEVVLESGKPFSEQQKKGKPFVDPLMIGIDRSREELYARINARVHTQLQNGMIEETRELLKKGYDATLPSMSGIGYGHIACYLDGKLSLEETEELIKCDTRRYAKRQLTWFRREKRIHWVKSEEAAEDLVREFLKML